MSQSVNAFIKSKLSDLPKILAFDLKALCWPVLLIPLILTAILAYLVTNDMLVHVLDENAKLNWMAQCETIALGILGLAWAVVAIRLTFQWKRYFWFLLLMISILLQREIRFEISNIAAHVAIGLLALWAWWGYRQCEDYFTSKWVVTLLALIAISYLTTQMLDQRFFRSLPQEELWEKQVEEAMEVVGHVFVLALAVLSRRGKLPSPLEGD
jgi:hypothetical protein